MEEIFENKRADTKALLSFGFVESKKAYKYSCPLLNGQFRLELTVFKDGKILTDVFDTATNEIYAPVKVFGAKGAFVKKIKDECGKILNDIAKKCFTFGIFKSDYTKKVIDYIKKKYKDEPEFLWEKFSTNAIFRRKDNAKWYAALLNIHKSKIGLESDEFVDIIDLKIEPDELDKLIDNKKYFAGYHMNKKHWFTVCLDGSVDIKEICALIDKSYVLAKK